MCMATPKESVFIPCGHRCACYTCSMDAFERYKKCPVCQTNLTGVLKKVFDWISKLLNNIIILNKNMKLIFNDLNNLCIIRYKSMISL
jgi:hypothetical protein